MTKHNLTGTRLYRIWTGMKQRCYNPNNPRYSDYGGKGVDICSEWLSDFQNFYNWSMENDYTDELTIDRIDSNKGYYPENCRWISRSSNSRRVWENPEHLEYMESIRKDTQKNTTMNLMEAKRKTKTSAAVKNRYNQKHYTVFRASVKPELFQRIEDYKTTHNLSNPQFLSKAIEALMATE